MRAITALLLAWFICGCKEISFETPQPKGKKELSAVPKTLRGRYLAVTDDGELAKDTIIITQRGYHFGYFDPADRAAQNDRYERGVISDSLVLKSYKGYYFINLYEKPEWLLRVLKQEKNGDLLYMAMEKKNTDFADYVNMLSQEIRIDSFQVDDKMIYRIDPDPNELVRLIGKGFFSEARLKKIK